MNRKLWPWLVALPWIAPPAIVLRYWLVWDRLPVHMATHFNANGQPNGWMTRQESLGFGLVMTAIMLVVFTVVCVVAYRKSESAVLSSILTGFFYFMIAFVYYANVAVLDYNLSGKPIALGPMMIAVPIAVIALTVAYLGASRGKSLPAEPAIAEEVHSSPLWTLVFVVPLAAELWLWMAVRQPGVRLGAALVSLMFAAFAAWTWSGFHYRFTPAGLEIRALGFRLRSIPAGQIQHYEVGRWSFLRGYGIRGVGKCRAYVWCNRGVRIRTADGEVFLGHPEPERIVRDLDAVKQSAQSPV